MVDIIRLTNSNSSSLSISSNNVVIGAMNRNRDFKSHLKSGTKKCMKAGKVKQVLKVVIGRDTLCN